MKKGFTLIELLVVVAIIGVLASVVLASLNTAREKGRDARRLADMHNIQVALDMYYNQYGYYPYNTDNDNGGWDTGCYGAGDTFISLLEASGFMPKTPCDPTVDSLNGGYRYYRYPAGNNGCDISRGAFYVLGIKDMETGSYPYSSNPGWSCSGLNWQSYFSLDWVTGKFEN